MPTICHDTDCTICDQPAVRLVCVDCGAEGDVCDCGHMEQPRPIAASAHDGRPVCAACEAKR